MAVAVGLHGALTQPGGLTEERKTAKPLTTRFVKRQPRLTKPLELKKHPRPERRQLRREIVAVRARAGRRELISTIRPSDAMGSVAKPRVDVNRFGLIEPSDSEPTVSAAAIKGTGAPENMVDLSLEMVDVDDLDTGQYHAIVIQDPSDRRNIRGFFHVARAYPQTVGSKEAMNGNNPGSRWALPRAIPALVHALNRWTGIEADMRGTFTFDSRELFRTPTVFIASHTPFRLTRAEASTLGQYLLSGGFQYTDTLLSLNQPANYHSIVWLWRDSLAAVGEAIGRHWGFERLPRSHGIYHCYYDFDRTPNGHDDYYWKRTGYNFGMADEPPDYLEGISLAGRLLGICTAKNYTFTWGYWPRSPGIDNTRQLQLGINFVIVSLTQEGSITHRLMDTIR